MSKSSERKNRGSGSFKFRIREAKGPGSVFVTLHGYRRADAIKKMVSDYGRELTFDVEEITKHT